MNYTRCGYICYEKITLSARSRDVNEAYIDNNFTYPIRFMTLDISYWSDNEKFTDDCVLKIQYKNHLSSWIDKIDLLNDLSLSTDRNSQSHLAVSFAESVSSVRIYCSFPEFTTYLNKNYGRVSIGDITFFH